MTKGKDNLAIVAPTKLVTAICKLDVEYLLPQNCNSHIGTSFCITSDVTGLVFNS